MKYIVASITPIFLIALVACSSSRTQMAIATAVVETVEAQAVQTGVAATQEAIDTPTPQPSTLCSEEAADFLEASDDLVERWFDALEIADSTPRMSLADPLRDLQALKRELADLEAPRCASSAKVALGRHMEDVIDGFLLFMQDEPDSTVSAKFDDASAQMDNYIVAVARIAAESTAATREASITPTSTD
jgi:hypothetical protein